MTWVIRKNSSQHKALNTLRLGPKGLAEMRKMIDYTQSIQKFQDEVINFLSNGGFIKRQNERFFITERGDNALIEHGAPRKIYRGTIHHIPGPTYQGLEILISVQRPGADDHLEYPSRRSGKLYYRDGRVEDV